jgi:anion-transporting  ArsA/GET3 family ATPase
MKFVVVTIPTILSIWESSRLMIELKEQGMCVSDVVVNQCVGDGGYSGCYDDGGGAEAMERNVIVNNAMRGYNDNRASGQRRWISELSEACREVSLSEEYRGIKGNVCISGEGQQSPPTSDVRCRDSSDY